jgi:YrbI family 3-deoxy-D-manno-octulosonate 8-phosphate phosphatase
MSIKLLILDIDGVMTDGGMYYTESGDEFKRFNSKDGLGIQRLIAKHGVNVGIISNGHNVNLINRRAALLGISHVYVGKGNKLEKLIAWCANLNISLSDVAFIGDDINDLECMQVVGTTACPADAMPKIKSIAHTILTRKGGDACVREFIEMHWEII